MRNILTLTLLSLGIGFPLLVAQEAKTDTCGTILLPAHLTEEAIDDFRLQGCTRFTVTDAEEWTRPRYVTIESFVK